MSTALDGSPDRLAMTAVYVGRHDDDGWTHDAWRVTLRLDGRRMTLTYRMGTGHDGAAPTLDGVLESLTADASGYDTAAGFEDWAADYGYDPDSRAAERTYRAVARQTRRLAALLGDAYDAAIEAAS